MAESAAALAPFSPPEGRRHHDRTHMFVAATLDSSAGSCPVHIRNMSNDGALIEGAVLADIGAEAMLRRGALQVSARIVWKAGSKAGLAFGAMVIAADWMLKHVPGHQREVDQIVRSIREGRPAGQQPGAPQPSPSLGPAAKAELEALKLELRQLESGLAGDMHIVASHPEIQLLDIAIQRIGRLLA